MAECSKRILSTSIELPFVIQIFVLSIFEWPFYTGFTVYKPSYCLHQQFEAASVQIHTREYTVLKN